MLPIDMAVYYLVWKYLVRFLNDWDRRCLTVPTRFLYDDPGRAE